MRRLRQVSVGWCVAGLFSLGLLNLSCLSRTARVHAITSVAPAGTPNILIIVGDDIAGGILGVDGDSRKATPRLDQLAKESVRFTRAYANSPVCTPSRQSFLCGRLPHATGVTQLTTPLDESTVTMADWLGELGYDTAAFGKMHFNSQLKHGFETRIDAPDWRRWLIANHPGAAAGIKPFRPFSDPPPVWLNAANKAVSLTTAQMEATYFVQEAKNYFDKKRERPFFMVVGFNQPHSPFEFPSDMKAPFTADDFVVGSMSEFDKYVQPSVFAKLTDEENRGIQAAYYNSIHFLDASVGKILDQLEASGQAENTIVVFIGDNGYLRGYHGRFEKHCLYEQAVKVPLLVRLPKRLPAGREVTAMVELVDLFPTLMELAGEAKPSNLHGRSLVALAKGEANAKGREYVFSEYLENEEAMIRSERYKLIVGTGARERQDGYENDKPLLGPTIRLYDEQEDPQELVDLSRKPELGGIIAEHRKALFDRLTTTRDGIKPELPNGLDELAAIHWCLVPRDVTPIRPAAKKKRAVRKS